MIFFLFCLLVQFFPTTSVAQTPSFSKCSPFSWTFYYYTFSAKYKIASETLVAEANQLLGIPKIMNDLLVDNFVRIPDVSLSSTTIRIVWSESIG